MTKSRSKLIALCVLALAGCNTAVLDVTRATLTAKMNSSVHKDRISVMTGSVVRAYKTDENGQTVELENVRCDLRSNEFSIRVSTPQIVKYPVLLQGKRFANRGKPSNLHVKCNKNGQSGTSVFVPITANLSSGGRAYLAIDANDGDIEAGVFTTPISTGQLSTTYPWRYDSVLRVELK